MIPILLRLIALFIFYFAYRISDSVLCVPAFVFGVFTWITAGRLAEIEKQ